MEAQRILGESGEAGWTPTGYDRRSALACIIAFSGLSLQNSLYDRCGMMWCGMIIVESEKEGETRLTTAFSRTRTYVDEVAAPADSVAAILTPSEGEPCSAKRARPHLVGDRFAILVNVTPCTAAHRRHGRRIGGDAVRGRCV